MSLVDVQRFSKHYPRVIALDDVKYGLRAGREIPTAELADAIEQLKEMYA